MTQLSEVVEPIAERATAYPMPLSDASAGGRRRPPRFWGTAPPGRRQSNYLSERDTQFEII